jgi:hypothetical protein
MCGERHARETPALPGVRRAGDVRAEVCQARWRLKKATIR